MNFATDIPLSMRNMAASRVDKGSNYIQIYIAAGTE